MILANQVDVWTPNSIPGLVAWMDARYPSDFTLAAAKVTRWANHGGSGGANWDVTDAGVAANRPTYTSGISVDFDGIANHLVSGAITLKEPYTLLLKAQINTGFAANTYILDGRVNNTGAIYNGASVNHIITMFNGVNFSSGQWQWFVDKPFRVGTVFSDDSSNLQVCGYTRVQGDAGNGADRSGWTLGSSGGAAQFLIGSIFWVLLYDNPLNNNRFDEIFYNMPI